jgi:hypothetical protein
MQSTAHKDTLNRVANVTGLWISRLRHGGFPVALRKIFLNRGCGDFGFMLLWIYKPVTTIPVPVEFYRPPPDGSSGEDEQKVSGDSLSLALCYGEPGFILESGL